MAIADDSTLVQLAAPRSAELFSLLNRADAFKPLVVLMAVLPGLFALEYRTFDEADALWGMKSLDVLTASDFEAVVDSGGTVAAELLKWQAPLSSWLTAVAMSIAGTSRPMGLLAVSYLSTAGLVCCSFLLCRRLGGPRFGFLTVLLLACHGPLLDHVSDTAPHSLAVLFGIVALWGFVAHLDDAVGTVSAKLLIAGIGLGLCLLAGGPLALMVMIILLLHVLGLRGEKPGPRKRQTSRRKNVWVGWSAIKSLAVLGLTAFAIGGWWVLMMRSKHGPEFWDVWLTGSVGLNNAIAGEMIRAEADSFASVVFRQFVVFLGVLFALSLFGLWRACREVLNSTDDARSRQLQFLLIWTGCALVVWLITLSNSPAESHVLELWQTFLMIPGIALAALALDEIARRHVSVFIAVGLTVLTFATFLQTMVVPSTTEISTTIWLWTALLIVGGFGILGWWLQWYCSKNDWRQRLVLSGLIIPLVVINAAMGLQSVRRVNQDDRSLAVLRDELISIRGVNEYVLVTESASSLRLQFVLRSIWPKGKFRLVEDWQGAMSQSVFGRFVRDGRPRIVVVNWGAREIRRPPPQFRRLDAPQPAQPQFLSGRPLRTYVFEAIASENRLEIQGFPGPKTANP